MKVAGDVVVTVNSPGEIATWLHPVVEALRRNGRGSLRIHVFIMPCLYGSGAEERVVRRIDGIDFVSLPKQSFRFALTGRGPAGFFPEKKGIVLHLGGEFALTARLARHLQFPAFAYTEGFINNAKKFETIFVPYDTARDQLIRRGVDTGKIQIVGNLMVDAAAPAPGAETMMTARQQLGIPSPGRVVALFPGSRPHEVRYGTPLLLEAAAEMEKAGSVDHFVLAVSPFADEGAEKDGWQRAAAYPRALTVFRGPSSTVMAAADLALAIPGSVTVELAAWGVPTVVCVPLDRAEEIPLEGIVGYVDRIPWIGKALKKKAVHRVARRLKYVSLPNRIADATLFPELISESLGPREVAQEALTLLRDEAKRRRLSRRLIDAMGPQGAADRLVDQLLQRLRAGKVGERRG